MKKVLPLILSLLFVATLSASASIPFTTKVGPEKIYVNLNNRVNVKHNTQKLVNQSGKEVTTPLRASAKNQKHNRFQLPAQSDLYGPYVADIPSGEGIYASTECMSIDISEETYTDVDGTSYEIICLTNFLGCDSIFAEYDSEDGTIYIPAQMSTTTQYAQYADSLIVYHVVEKTDDGMMNCEGGAILVVQEDENGSYIEMEESQLGICTIAKGGMYDGEIFLYAANIIINPANYHQVYHTLDLNDEYSDWVPNHCNTYIEDFGNERIVHGLAGMYTSSIKIEGDEYYVPSAQKLYYNSQDEEWLKLCSIGDEPGVLCLDEDYHHPILVLDNGTICFGYNNEDGETMLQGYYMLYSYDPATGNFFGVPNVFAFEFIPQLVWEQRQEGVGTVLSPAATSKAAFNLQGQRVNTLGKGINLWNGKKYLVK